MGQGAGKLLGACLDAIDKDDPGFFGESSSVLLELLRTAVAQPSSWKATWSLGPGGILGHRDMTRNWTFAGEHIGVETLQTSVASVNFDSGRRKLQFRTSVQAVSPRCNFIFGQLGLQTEGSGKNIQAAYRTFASFAPKTLSQMVIDAHRATQSHPRVVAWLNENGLHDSHEEQISSTGLVQQAGTS